MPPLMGSSLPLKAFSFNLSQSHSHPFSPPPHILSCLFFKSLYLFSFPLGLTYPVDPEPPDSSTSSASVPLPEAPLLILAPGHPNCSSERGWGGGWKFWYHSSDEVLELSSAEGPAGIAQSQSLSARRQFINCQGREALMASGVKSLAW